MEQKVMVPVYKDGNRIVKVEMTAILDNGDLFVTPADALRWEQLHLQLANTIHASSRLTKRGHGRHMFISGSSAVVLQS